MQPLGNGDTERKQFLNELKHSIERLENKIDMEQKLEEEIGREFGHVKTLKDLIDVQPEHMLMVVRRVLWECAEQPKSYEGPLVCSLWLYRKRHC